METKLDSKIKILIVDDAVTDRRFLTHSLQKESSFEVVGTAGTGAGALSKIPLLSPDLVTLDYEMPELNGVETLAEIRKKNPDLPVIMVFGSVSRRKSIALQLLSYKMTDYMSKPTSPDDLQRVKEFEIQLSEKIKRLYYSKEEMKQSFLKTQEAVSKPSKGKARVEVVVIGVSTGGPDALNKVISEMPKDFSVPILITQHMPPLFTQYLAEALNAKSKIPVAEAVNGSLVTPGKIWLAPGDYHMIVENDCGKVRLRTHQGVPENSCRPSVDVLFRSAAEVYGSGVLGVVLTGMGNDGMLGSQEIVAKGGTVVAQDEKTSVVWGMPGAVVQAGLATVILPLSEIASYIQRRTYRHGLNDDYR